MFTLFLYILESLIAVTAMAAAGGGNDGAFGACGGLPTVARVGPSRIFAIDDDYDDNDDHDNPSRQSQNKIPSSNPRKRLRPKCQYGQDCYRKNPHHFTTYCHPKDAEWSQGDENRPKARCPFGIFCTR